MDELDTTFVSLEGLPRDAEYCPVTPAPEPFSPGKQQRVYLIGYPSGGSLSFSLEDSILIDSDGIRLHYRTSTVPGSGGSPVFDDHHWTLLGIHHKRLPNDTREGISIQAIRAAILKSGYKTANAGLDPEVSPKRNHPE